MKRSLIKLLLVDNHVLFRKGLKAILVDYPDFEIIGDFSDIKECIPLLQSEIVDIILIDTDFQNVSFREIKVLDSENQKTPKIVALTFANSLNDSLDVISSGVDGYLLKDEEIDDLITYLINTSKGIFVLSDKLVNNLVNLVRQKVEFPISFLLSERELEVLKLVFSGYSNKQVSQALYLSENTIKTHLKHIYNKLSVKSRKEAIIKAKLWGIFR